MVESGHALPGLESQPSDQRKNDVGDACWLLGDRSGLDANLDRECEGHHRPLLEAEYGIRVVLL